MPADAGPALAFPQREYARRLDLVQAEIARRSLEGIVVLGPANLYYLTGYETIGYSNFQLSLVPRTGEPRLLVRELEAPLARHGTWLTTEPTFYSDDQRPVDHVRELLAVSGLEQGTVGIDMSSTYLTVRMFQALSKALPSVRFQDGSGIIESVRRVKSDLELKCFRTAATYTALGMASALAAVHEGAIDNEVGAAAADAMYRAGSEYFASGPTVTTGRRSGIPHTTFQRTAIEAGDAVLIEIGGNHHRYTTPLMRSALVGPASDLGRRMYDACSRALDAAIASVKPGVTASSVHLACQRVIDEAGFESNFRKRLGYSMGVGFAPGWGEGAFLELSRTDDTVLEPGMVFHLPPALRVEAVIGVGCSETLAVTESGVEVFGNFPRDLTIV